MYAASSLQAHPHGLGLIAAHPPFPPPPPRTPQDNKVGVGFAWPEEWLRGCSKSGCGVGSGRHCTDGGGGGSSSSSRTRSSSSSSRGRGSDRSRSRSKRDSREAAAGAGAVAAAAQAVQRSGSDWQWGAAAGAVCAGTRGRQPLRKGRHAGHALPRLRPCGRAADSRWPSCLKTAGPCSLPSPSPPPVRCAPPVVPRLGPAPPRSALCSGGF